MFEGAAVVMIAVGIGLISMQLFLSLPENKQSKVASSFDVFEMSDAIASVWEVESTVNEYVFNGVEDFYKEFHVAFSDVMPSPDAEIKSIASTLKDVSVAYFEISDSLVHMSETLASNYENNYAVTGVEASVGGKIMGAYIERLSE
ncbi:MAG: hypothetical protein KW793_04335 [Candidatus Doudnabacteria bacterium]|nr:hypothetical protein [Candidatus Doudnabacteria bacterium]